MPPQLYRHLVHLLAKIYLEFSDYEGVREVSAGIENDDIMSWALGCAYLGEGDKNEALRYFREAVGLNPANDRAWVSLSMLHDEMGDRELALANLERALEINPDNSTALKLMSKWHTRHLEKSLSVMDRIQYYLDRHGFDEEISLCYVQLLQENRSLATADFELSKLILNNPANAEFYRMKKNLEDQTNL
jgi:tetratricopeptide (TPR) repeat protein